MRRSVLVGLTLLAACNSPQKAREPGGSPSAESAPLARSDPADPAAECKARCNGEFAAHGLNGTPHCLCRTRDFGKSCESSGECEGQCIADPALTRVTDAGPPKRGFYVGRCSEFITSFGCSPILPKAKPGGPVEVGEPPATVCMD
ncbi:MAG TPA: hypothetical protein VFQ35_22415 [Polyangiaceae bacterium]|nr:hypothetical protein [Polyangiaceae bacterium]